MTKLWREEHDLLLITLCASGEEISASEIGRRISERFNIWPVISRHAVKGRTRRLGIELPKEPTQEINRRSLQEREALAEADPPMPVEQPEVRLPRERQELLHDPTPDEPGVLLVNAAASDCRRPLNRPQRGHMAYLRVCGEPATRGNYCAECYRRLYHLVPEPTGRPFVVKDHEALKRAPRLEAVDADTL